MALIGPESTGTSPRAEIPTLGVEEEFVLVDPNTGRPKLRNTEVVDAGADLGIDLQVEFTACQIETATSIGAHIQDLRDQLCESRALTADAAARTGCQLLAVGTPIFDPPPDSITDTPRYRRMAARLGGLAAEAMCGCHIHVGVADREEGIQVSNRLRPWLPTLLALTANSPIAGGVDTGYASWRHIRFGRWPSAGPPPYFESAARYDAAVETMLETGSILDRGMIYWDVRISDHLPTVEIRISDVPATIIETITLTTVVHALVITALGAIRRGDAAPAIDQDVLRGACWRAARDGLAGHGLDLTTTRLVSAHQLIHALLLHTKPALEELGEYEQVATSLAEVLDQGNGAIRQRRILNRRGNLDDVLSDCAARTFEGCLPEPGGALPL